MDEIDNPATQINSSSQKSPSGQTEQQLNKVAPELFKRFVEIQAKAIDLAQRQQKSDDTESGVKHLISVHKLVDRLVPLSKLQNYKPIELFILMVSIYLHDIGKSIGQKTNANSHHALLSRDTVMRISAELGLEEPEALAVGYIVEGHGPDNIGELPEKTGVHPYGIIRIKYLAALLRLADDLDLCFTRAPRIAHALVQPESKIDTKWTLRQSFWNLEIDPNSWLIEAQATPKTLAEQAAVLREIEIINGRLADVRKYLRSTPDIGLYYSLIDIYIDYFWIRKLSQSQIETLEGATSEKHPITLDLPDNPVCVILQYDSTSVALYKKVISPCLEECGFSPIIIENLLPEKTLLERAIEGIDASKVIVVLLPGGYEPSVHFRLGIAMGLHKKILAFTSPSTTTIGDLCGMEINVFENEEDLRKQLLENLKKS